MDTTSQFESLSQRLLAVLPPYLKTIEQDVQQQFKAILLGAFAKMDIVTREEFDVQVNVLARTREKIEELQRTVDALVSNR